MVGLAKATIYLKMKEGSFPKNFKIGARACAWLESDIEQWIDEACNKD
jgi:prophage regulatory protein